MPQLGESIAEATIVDIKVKPGDEVVTDQEIIEVETNKAVMGVTTLVLISLPMSSDAKCDSTAAIESPALHQRFLL